jgi:hypothetical protein
MSHGLPSPLVEELARPSGRVVFPELLERFLEKVSSNGFEIVAEEIAQSEVLFNAKGFHSGGATASVTF